MFAWVAVFVLPLNAAINPVLYTLSTAPFLTPARHGLLSFRRSCKLSRYNNYSSSGITHNYGEIFEILGASEMILKLHFFLIIQCFLCFTIDSHSFEMAMKKLNKSLPTTNSHYKNLSKYTWYLGELKILNINSNKRCDLTVYGR